MYDYVSERLINVLCTHYHLKIKHIPLIMPLDEYDNDQNISDIRATFRRIKNDYIYKIHR